MKASTIMGIITLYILMHTPHTCTHTHTNTLIMECNFIIGKQ